MKSSIKSAYRLAAVSGIITLALFAFTPLTHAATLAPASAPCDVIGTPFLTLTQKITEPDSGSTGNWANDTLTENVNVWLATDGSGIFCANGNTTDGKFITTGPNSPEAGIPLSAGISGSFTGGETWIFPAGTATTTSETSLTLSDDNSLTGSQFNNWQSYVFNQTVGASTYLFTYTVDGNTNDTWTNADSLSNPPSGNSGDILNSPIVTVYSESQLNTELADTSVTTIKFGSDITTTAQISINRAVTIDGQGHTLFAPFAKTSNTNNSAIGITHSDVTIKNLIEDGTGSTGYRHGINVFEAVLNVNINDVTVEKNAASGITVNGSNVTVSNITTKNNTWGGINADQASDAPDPTVLTITGKSTQTETNADIWVDDNTKNVTINDSNHQYSHTTYTHTDTHGVSFVGTAYKLLETGQTTPDDSGNATVTDTNKDVVVASSTQPVTIDAGDTKDGTIDFGSLITGGTGTIPQITVNSNTADVEIPSTTITSTDTSWNGTINLPTVTTTTVQPTPTTGNTTNVINSIEVGFGNTPLTLNDAAKLTFAGQAGDLIGWSQNGVFHEITATCDSPTAPTLATGADCKVDVGSNLVVWTKHFTTFTTYTQTAIPAPVFIPGGHQGGGGGGSVSLPAQASSVAVAHTQGQVLGAEAVSPAIQAKIDAVKAQIIDLIKQLIALLQAQILAQ